MILREPVPEDLRQHKTWVAGLIAEGKRLVTEALSRGGIPEGVRSNLAGVEATLEMLYLAQRESHRPKMLEARRREILKAVFNVAESGT